MSRIFDALQRSGTEQTGIEYPDMVSVLTEVFEPARQEQPQIPLEIPSPEMDLPASLITQAFPEETPASTLAEFPSVEISPLASSRLVFFTQPESLAAEKFRFLGVKLRQMQQARSLKKLLITSTIPEEGKSLVCANLAGVLAKRNQKVLLIEGDLRRPVLAEHFGLGRLAGLAEWLQGHKQKLTNIYHLNGVDFWLMPAGNPPSNPLELMTSASLQDLAARLTRFFDWIIVDSPPLLPLADTSIWERVADGTLLVTRVGQTQKSQLKNGLELIKKANLLGVVLNSCSDADHDNYYQRYSPK